VQQQQRPEQGGVEYQDGKRQGTAQSIGHPAEQNRARDARKGLDGKQRGGERG